MPCSVQLSTGYLVHVFDDAEEQVLLGIHVVIETALEKPCGAGDVIHRRLRITLFVEQLLGDVHDRLSSLETLGSARRRACGLCRSARAACHEIPPCCQLLRVVGRGASWTPRRSSSAVRSFCNSNFLTFVP